MDWLGLNAIPSFVTYSSVYRLYMTMIRAAAPADYRQFRQDLLQLRILLPQLVRVAGVEFSARVEFRVAEPGCICA
jgi:hypothetical protein